MFSLNTQSLAIYRIVLSIFSAKVLLNIYFFKDFILGNKHFDISDFSIDSILNGWPFSLYLLNNSEVYQNILVAIGLIACSCLLLGKFTKLSILLIWILQASFITINPMVPSGSDMLLMTLLFWTFFLPVDQFYCLGKQNNLKTFSSFTSFFFIAQIALIYLSTSINKYDLYWHEESNAIFYALSLEYLTSDLGLILLSYPGLLKLLTKLTWHIEFFGGFLLLIPYIERITRPVLCLLFIMLHLGILIFQDVGDFPYISISCWIALAPSSFWSFLKSKHKREQISKERIITKVFTSTCFIIIAYTNLYFLSSNIYSKEKNPLNKYRNPVFAISSQLFRLEQSWGMFGPHPPLYNAWLVIVEKESKINLITNKAFIDEKPKKIRNLFQSEYHKKFFEYILEEEDKTLSSKFLEYFCYKYNLKGKTLLLYLYREETKENILEEKYTRELANEKRCG